MAWGSLETRLYYWLIWLVPFATILECSVKCAITVTDRGTYGTPGTISYCYYLLTHCLVSSVQVQLFPTSVCLIALHLHTSNVALWSGTLRLHPIAHILVSLWTNDYHKTCTWSVGNSQSSHMGQNNISIYHTKKPHMLSYRKSKWE